VPEEPRQTLERLACAQSTAQQLALRARILLRAAAGWSQVPISQHRGLARATVRRGRDRGAGLQDVPLDELGVAARLAAAPRPGAPVHLGAAQVCAIRALACAAPAPAARPISQWTGREIADEIRRRGSVPRRSPRPAARLRQRGIAHPRSSATG
jgi:putative transposase